MSEDTEPADRQPERSAGGKKEQLWLLQFYLYCSPGMIFLWMPSPKAWLDFMSERFVVFLFSNI